MTWQIEKREISRREMLRWLGIGAAGAVASACAPSATSVVQETATREEVAATAVKATALPTPTSEFVTKPLEGDVTIWAWDVLAEAVRDVYETYVQPLHKDDPISVTITGVPDYEKKLSTAIIGGTPPDAFALGDQVCQSFITKGWCKDLTDIMTPLKDDYFPFKIVAESHEGKVYGIPDDVGHTFIHYRPDLFEEAGVAPDFESWIWDEYFEVGKQLLEAGYLIDYIVPSDGFWTPHWFHSLMRMLNSGMFDGEGNLQLTSPEAIKTMTFMKDCYQAGLWGSGQYGGFSSPDYWTACNSDLIAAAFSPSWNVGHWNYIDLKEGESESWGKWRVAPMPAPAAGMPRSAEYMSSGFYVSPGVEGNKLELVLAVLFAYCHSLTAGKQKIGPPKFLEEPALVEVWEDPEVLNYSFEGYGGQKANQVLAELLEECTYNASFPPSMPEAASKLMEYLPKIWEGDIAVQDGLNTAAEEIEEKILPKYR